MLADELDYVVGVEAALIAVLVGVAVWIVQIGERHGAVVWVAAIVAFVAGGVAGFLGFRSKRFGPAPLGSQVREAGGWKSLAMPIGGAAVAWAIAAISGATQMIVLSFLLGFMLAALVLIFEGVVHNPARWPGSGRT